MRRFRLALAFLLILSCATIALWIARRPLTEIVVARWFAAQGVEAQYRIDALSPTGVLLSAVALGPAAHPDLTADRVEATVVWSPLRPQVKTVRLIRPDLHGSLSRKGISFGALDRLIPAPVRPARPLPDIDVTLVEGRLRLDTPAGKLAGEVNGSGRLGGGFRGNWRIDPSILAGGGCTTRLTNASATLATAPRSVLLAATGTLPSVTCARGHADAVNWSVAVTSPPTLDRYSARIDARASAAAAGSVHATGLLVRATATAPARDGPVAGQLKLHAGQVSEPSIGTGQVAGIGPFRFDSRTGAGSFHAKVTLSQASATAAGVFRRTPRQLAGTLAQPLYAALLSRTAGAARSFTATGQVAARIDAGGYDIELSGLDARAASGATVRQSGRLALSADTYAVDGDATLSGGGFPTVSATGTGSAGDGAVSGVGTLVVEPWAVPGAAIHGLIIEANARKGRVTLTGAVRASGVLGAGVRAERFRVAFQLNVGPRGQIAYGPRCWAVDWDGLARDTLALGPGYARICPSGSLVAGSAIVAPLRLAGRLGDTPLSVTSTQLSLRMVGDCRSDPDAQPGTARDRLWRHPRNCSGRGPVRPSRGERDR